MKALIGIAFVVLWAQSDNVAEEARKYVEDYLKANPDIDPKVVEGIVDDKAGAAEIKVGDTVDTMGVGDRHEGEAGVEGVRHEISSAGAAQDFTLRAPQYPGSVAVHRTEESRDGYAAWRIADDGSAIAGETRSFLSKDDLDSVRAYYDREFGAMAAGSLSYQRIPEEMRPSSGPEPYTYAHGAGYDDTGGLAGVEIQSLEPSDMFFTRYPAIGPVFERLNVSVVGGHTSQEKFDSLLAEYKHLGWSYFPLTDQRTSHGRPLSRDKVIFEDCKKNASGGMTPEQMQAKMQELMAQGKMQEMQKLAQNMAAGSGMESEDVWIDCLKELESESYATLITVHVAPR